MRIIEPREAYKPFEYPEYFDYYKRAIASVWRVEEVDFQSDLRDWQQATDQEREIIGGILRGFTQLECHVSDYWANMAEYFPKHEIQAACRAFSLFECIHSQAYSHLSDTLGLNEYEAFLGDPIAQAKLGAFMSSEDPRASIGVFSGAGEGVSLFSSFAVLLAFNLKGRFKGLSQIISWSALDEQMHHDMGCKLFRQFVELTPEVEQLVYEGFDLVIRNELNFIESIFKNDPEFCGGNLGELINFIFGRANKALINLGLVAKYHYDINDPIKAWFDPIVSGNSSHDFFAQSKDGANYTSKLNINLASVNIKELNEWVQGL